MAEDEIVVVTSVTVAETILVRPAAKPTVIDEHWCMHAGCKEWGSFGYQTRCGTEWYCGSHREDGEAKR